MAPDSPQADAPVFAFHEASFRLADLSRHIVIAVLGGVPVLGLPIKLLLHPERWPPDAPPVVLWLGLAGLIGWISVIPMAATLLRVRRGEAAGLRVAEGDEYLEVAFFIGDRACRVQRFAYAEITGCGTARFSVDSLGGTDIRPYVATRGIVRDSVKTPIPLGIGQDARGLAPGDSYAIAVDLDRIIRRHCDLPVPEKSLDTAGKEQTQAMVREAWLRPERR